MLRQAALAAFVLLFLSACATSARVTRGGGEEILQAQAEPVVGGRYRIVVAEVIDQSDPTQERSLARQINLINATRDENQRIEASAITDGVRDMLVTDLFASDRFIVMERDDLDGILVEQEFSQSARAGDTTRLPRAQLEGAELVVLTAITGFDGGLGGGALPIPVPFKVGNNYDLGLLSVSFRRGWVAMDVRVVDARTGRILSATAVEGRNTRWGLDFTAFVDVGHRYRRLPGVLKYFSNTPVEEALQAMVTVAVQHIEAHVH